MIVGVVHMPYVSVRFFESPDTSYVAHVFFLDTSPGTAPCMMYIVIDMGFH